MCRVDKIEETENYWILYSSPRGSNEKCCFQSWFPKEDYTREEAVEWEEIIIG